MELDEAMAQWKTRTHIQKYVYDVASKPHLGRSVIADVPANREVSPPYCPHLSLVPAVTRSGLPACLCVCVFPGTRVGVPNTPIRTKYACMHVRGHGQANEYDRYKRRVHFYPHIIFACIVAGSA